MRLLAFVYGHCLHCTSLSGCYFEKQHLPNNVDINSKNLLHNNCDCYLIPADDTGSIRAFCPIEKFTEYIFSPNYILNGKKMLFESYGYSIYDSWLLKLEYEKQATEKYLKGEYKIENLDNYGQNISIIIELSCSSGMRTIKSGWKIHPLGLITCSTPFTGR